MRFKWQLAYANASPDQHCQLAARLKTLHLSPWPAAIYPYYCPNGSKCMSNSQRVFDVYLFVLKSNSCTKKIIHICVFASVTEKYWERSEQSVSYSNPWCSECFTYVYVHCIPYSGSKTKNAHVFSRQDSTIGPNRITQLIRWEFSGVTEVKFITPINSLRIFWCNWWYAPS